MRQCFVLVTVLFTDRSNNTVSSKTSNIVKESEDALIDDSADDFAPLFYCPGKAGFYSPRQGKATFERLNAFRNVGRYVVNLCDSCFSERSC